MPHPDNVQKQLAHEEAELAQTRQEILSTKERIQQAERQVVELRERLSSLTEREAAVEKRVDLLRQYIEIAPPVPESESDTGTGPDDEDTGYAVSEATSREPGQHQPDTEATDLGTGLLKGLDNMVAGSTVPAPQRVPAPPQSPVESPGSFEELDDESLSMELLPRTQTFEEELLIVLAYHRKAVEPKEVARLFRRLDHAPKIKPTESNVKAQISSTPHLYEQTSEGRFGLSQEGREEAQRLLMGLV